MASRSLKNRPDIKKKHATAGTLSVFLVITAVFAAFCIGVYAVGSSWLEDLPDYKNADAFNTAQKTRVYANDKQTLLAELYLENREPVKIDQISPYVLEGTVATEDERFYEHNGVDLYGIARAVVVNITGSSREGASTITQQFIRGTILANEATDISIKRKVREAYLALKIEEEYSKDEILLMYLNTINYGSGAYGIEAASLRYFSKHATELSLVEAATLIGIPQSPTYNNPIDNPELSLERRNVVLERMRSNGYITQAEYDEAVVLPIELNVQTKPENGIYAYPYFTTYVRQVLLNEMDFDTSEVFKGGLTVYTTIDPAIQAAAEQAAANKEETVDDDMAVAMTAVDQQTGFIKAMVGGKDFNEDAQWNLATQAQRSPGSSFKTFTLIAALEQGISPQTYVNCSAYAKIDGWEGQIENYFAAEYGTRTIAGAYEVSSNTGFARLISAIGPDKVADVAKRMGIKSEVPPFPAITLGGLPYGVTTLEMAEAYATIASGGVHRNAVAIETILDRNGEVIYQADTTGEQVLTPEVAGAATKIMEGVINNGTGTQARLWSGQIAAGKTGTSEDFKDSYFCGFTPQLTVAIWMGVPDPPRSMATYYTVASVFSDFMGMALEGQELVDFPEVADPTYTPYTNSKLYIGGYYAPTYNYNTPNTDTETDKKTDDSATNSNNSSGNSGGSSGGGGSADPGGSSGGTDSGSGDGSAGGSSGSGGASSGDAGGGSSGSGNAASGG